MGTSLHTADDTYRKLTGNCVADGDLSDVTVFGGRFYEPVMSREPPRENSGAARTPAAQMTL